MMSADSQDADLSRMGLAVLALLVSLGLLLLAWPRLQASLAFLPVDTALEHHWADDTPSTEQLAALSERAGQAFAHQPHYRYLDAQSLLAYLQATDPALNEQDRQALLTTAATRALQSVVRAPMKPDAWLRIAMARHSLGDASEDVAAPLVMSVYSGRVEPTLLLLRLRMLYELQNALDADQLRLVTDQTLLAWRLQPRELVQDVLKGAIAYDRVAGLLLPAHGPVMDEIDEAIRAAAR